jgi:hypothetical protein
VSLAVWLHPRLRRVAVLAARPVASD